MDYLELLTIFNIVIIVLIGLFILNWINNLDKIKCECSNTNKKVFIKAWWFFIIVYYISEVFIYLLSGTKDTLSNFIKYNNLLLGFNLIIGFLSAIMIVVTYKYINYLKTSNCKCSQGKTQELLYIYSKINIAIIGFILLLMIFVGLTFIFK
jgi:Na+-driven multidrug efflux pump